MKKRDTIFIIEREKDTGKDIARRILNYTETFVRENNCLEKLDNILHTKFKDGCTFSSELKENDPFKYKAMLVKEFNGGSGEIYPQYISLTKRDYNCLITYNPSIILNNQILGMKIKIYRSKNKRRKG